VIILQNVKFNKIHVIGSVGSGKTTLARKLSTFMNIPHYELDNVVWKRNPDGDIRRTDEERDEYLSKIISKDKWIIEGAQYSWVSPSFEQADLILLLDPVYLERKKRILKRFILQKLGLEKSNYKPTLDMLKKMFEWNKHFEIIYKPEILEILKLYKDKLIVLEDHNGIEKFLSVKGIAIH